MTDVLALLLIVLPPFDWFVALVLTVVSVRHPDILTLRERAVAAVALAIAATLAGTLAWAYFGFLRLPEGSALVILASALILVSVPSLLWLALLLTGRFRVRA